MVIYEPNPPIKTGVDAKTIQNYPELIEFIQHGGVVINNEQTVRMKRVVGLFSGKTK